MRSRQLESALTAFVEDAALLLCEHTAAGEEVPFEIVAQGSRAHRAPLYCYRPLTGEFIGTHATPISALASHAPALAAIGAIEGLGRYVLARGAAQIPVAPGERAGLALRLLLADVFDGQSDFELRPEHLRAALDRLEIAVRPDGDPVAVVGTLHGLTLASEELALAHGLTIAAPGAIDGVPEEALALQASGTPHLLVILTAEGEDPDTAVDDAGDALRDLVRALRLFGDGRLALGPLGWSRVGSGPWRPFALGAGGRPHGMLVVTAEQEDELRAFCSLVSRRAPRDDELAWALERYQLGCERASDHVALTDYLLALRALLEPEGPASGMLAGRLAAICALPADRQSLVDRVLRATELERSVIRGEATRSARGDALVQAIAGHLRALLRDLICGHLDRDLVAVADELLLGASSSESVAFVASGASVAGGAGVDSVTPASEDAEVADWFTEPTPEVDNRSPASRTRGRFARPAPTVGDRAPVRAPQDQLPF